eukprot:CAMPEP_0197721206 /NCGR_PEP_ID=MMETSP1434-20131217/4338_1 /TAXON_ID=265543 /ORGANISM="Minutocellus polymorphus, Strain CCMP3303" /LENGTH=171 /DNA_ID=CAMNT_0043306181 /DNA_START=14 /DNA_END=526 /DNA_ORIENTATION=+
MPSFSAWTDGCQCQHGQGGICGDGADFAGYLSKIETAERKKANRKKFTRKKVNQVDAIILTMGQGSFPCAERVNYYVENRSIVMKKTNNWFEGAGCQEINEEKTKRINQQQFRRLRKKLNTYKIKRCKPDYFTELLGLGDVDSVGGSYLGLVLLSENGREMLDENGSRLCG